jgi:arsenate reductase
VIAGVSHCKNRRASAIMAEAGIDIAGQDLTMIADTMIQTADLVATVCGHADEHCPVLPAGTHKEHWSLGDPAKATGTEERVMAVFRASRDDIRRRVTDLLDRLRREHER